MIKNSRQILIKSFLTNFAVILVLLSSSVLAKTINAGVVEPISTIEPLKIYQLEIIDTCKVHKNLIFKEGGIITGNVIEIKKPKHWHRDAYIVFRPTLYTINDNTIDLTDYKIKAKIAKFQSINIFGPATWVILNTAEFMIPGVFEACSFVNGYQQADEHKIKAGFKRIYKDSPFAYPEKGSELETTKGDYVLLKLNFKK